MIHTQSSSSLPNSISHNVYRVARNMACSGLSVDRWGEADP